MKREWMSWSPTQILDELVTDDLPTRDEARSAAADILGSNGRSLY